MKGTKTGGRKKGTPNKITATTRGTLQSFLQKYETTKLAKDFAELDAKDRILMFERLLSYIMPKVQSADEVEGACYTREDVYDYCGDGRVRNWMEDERDRIAEAKERKKKMKMQETTWCLGECDSCVIEKECPQRKMLNGLVAEKNCWFREDRLWAGCGDCDKKDDCEFHKQYGNFGKYVGADVDDEDEDDEDGNGEEM